MKNTPYLLFAAGLLYLLFPLQLRAEGGPAFLLNSLSVVCDNGRMRLEASVSVREPATLQANLRDGAALNLEATVLVERPRTLLPNKNMYEQHMLYQIRFDPLTREYLLLRPSAPPLRQRSLPALLEGVLGDAAIPLSPPAVLLPGETYQVSLTLGMRHAEVPPWLERTLFFWSWDIITPTTFSLDFVYDDNGHAVSAPPEAEHA